MSISLTQVLQEVLSDGKIEPAESQKVSKAVMTAPDVEKEEALEFFSDKLNCFILDEGERAKLKLALGKDLSPRIRSDFCPPVKEWDGKKAWADDIQKKIMAKHKRSFSYCYEKQLHEEPDCN